MLKSPVIKELMKRFYKMNIYKKKIYEAFILSAIISNTHKVFITSLSQIEEK